MARSAIEALLCNVGPGYDQQWEIPVCVTSVSAEGDVEGTVGEPRRKMLIVDKPLAQKTMTPREKNTLYFEKVCVGAGAVVRPASRGFV